MAASKRSILDEHVKRLCVQNGIRVREIKSYNARAYSGRGVRAIAIHPVKTEVTYIVALHEIGHLIGPNRSGRRLEKEAAAWEFVIEQSIVPLSSPSYRRMRKALDSYLARATRRKMVIPAPGDSFWQTYELIRARSHAVSRLTNRSASAS
jgi:hypothetical protein